MSVRERRGTKTTWTDVHIHPSACTCLLVDDAHQLLAHAVVPQLALHDARAEALVDKHAAGLLAALEVLARALGGPRARLCVASVDAELDAKYVFCFVCFSPNSSR